MDTSPFPIQVQQELSALNIQTYTFDEIVEKGRNSRVDLPQIAGDDLYFICYSSGTTGSPKGVVVNHQTNASNQISAAYEINLGTHCHYLSYLPLAHVFERVSHGTVKIYGGRYGFTSQGIRSIVDDLMSLKPTVLIVVPRVAIRFYDTIQNKIKSFSFLKRWIFWTFYRMKEFCLARRIPTLPLDLCVFNQIMSTMGGHIGQFICGSAACPGQVSSFLQTCLGAPFRVGYGLTEAGSGNILQKPQFVDCIPNTVGGPLSNVEVRLEPIDDYYDPEAGEILIGGPCLCSGYFKDEEATRNLFYDDQHTWIRTGDVAKWHSNGHLVIVDRLRSIFKLSQGEYVAAEYLTQIYSSADIISQIFVYGDSSRSVLVGIVLPEKSEVAKYLGKESLSENEYVEACRSKDLESYILEILTQTGKEKGLVGFAFLKAIKLDSYEWNVENDLLTPTFKQKRHNIQRRYQAQINQMYEPFEQL